MKKPTKEQLKQFIREEKASAKLYHSLGFHNVARDEERHAEFFENRLYYHFK